MGTPIAPEGSDHLNIVDVDLWTLLQNTDRPVIVYGMGNGADKIIDHLLAVGKKPYGVMASDEFVRGQSFREYPVKRLSDFEKETNHPIILTAFGSQRPDVIKHIRKIAAAHTLYAPDVPVYGDTLFDKRFYKEHRSELESAFDMMADDLSRQTLENVINFKLSGNIDFLTKIFSDKDEAFRHILCLEKSESFLDLGAYRGDTIQEFLTYTNGCYSHITALEPDAKTFRKLKIYAGKMPNVQLFNMGIWNDDTDLKFDASLGRGSSIRASGTQSLAVTKIDTLYRRHPLTILKMDVEGSEHQALLGGINTLQRDKPKINMALYHRSEDLFDLPLLLHQINPSYRFYLRQHPHIPAWDLNLYAI